MRLSFVTLTLVLIGCSNSSPSALPAPTPALGSDTATPEVGTLAPDAALGNPSDATPAVTQGDAGTTPARPMLDGPYGTTPRSVAAPFTVPTTEGDWSLREHWSSDDHYLFAVHAPGVMAFPNGSDYSRDLFKGKIAPLLTASPKNTHYFFLWLKDEPGFQAFQKRVLQELEKLSAPDREHWAKRMHFVTPKADKIEGWVGDLVRDRMKGTAPYTRYDPLQWAIDRTQHVREVGMLGTLAKDGIDVDLSMLASEAVYYEFERKRDERLAATKTTVVNLVKEATVVDVTTADVELPNAATMASFDTLEADLTMNCEHHRDGECGAWDYISDLRLCEVVPPVTEMPDAGAPDGGTLDAAVTDAAVADATLDTGAADARDVRDAEPDATMPRRTPPELRCDTEIARWITSYWREGRWVTDISGMLAFLQQGGHHTFRWSASRQWDPRPANYVVSLSLRFSNTGKGMRPVSAQRLFGGATLNADYNIRPAAPVSMLPQTKKAEIYALVTGHGSETSQCAEFCNHTHHFTVNGNTHSLKFPEARSLSGCRDRVGEGVVPNQHGTWYFGRGGWCPGFDVRPFTADVTADLRGNLPNEITYRALIGTTEPAAGKGYGNVQLTSYLISWQ